MKKIIMCTETQKNLICSKLVSQFRDVLGEKLYCVLLYGSYARGDFDEESDMDIMVIADIPQIEISNYRKAINHIATKTGMENDILLSVSMMDKDTIYKQRKVLPFFDNVLREGKKLYAS